MLKKPNSNHFEKKKQTKKQNCIVNLIVSFYFVKIEICVFDSKSQVNNMIN